MHPLIATKGDSMKSIFSLGFLFVSILAFANLEDDAKSKAKKEEWVKGGLKQQRQEDETHKRKHQTQPPQINPLQNEQVKER